MFRDKRPVDQLSIEELERILATRKREARLERARQYAAERRIAPVEETGLPDLPVSEIEDDLAGDDITLDDSIEGVIVDSNPFEQPAVPRSATPSRALSVSRQSTNNLNERNDLEAEVTPMHFEGEPRFEDEAPSRPRERRPREAALPAERSSLAQAIKSDDHASRRSRILAEPHAAPIRSRTPRRRLMNSILLGVEVAAVVGLIALVVYLFQAFLVIQQRTATEQLNAEATTIAAYVPPTATPIINVKARVLPSGHVFGEGADARFNLDEVPLEYRAQYQSLLDAPPVRPTPSPEGPIRIQIPAIAVDRQVVYGDDWEALKLGVGHHPGSVNPGQTGNLVLTAHNDVYGEIFRDLDKLKPGDQVFVSTTSKSYTYVIQETIKVKPTDTWVLDARGDIQQITLISCYPYRQNTQRIVLFGVLQS